MPNVTMRSLKLFQHLRTSRFMVMVLSRSTSLKKLQLHMRRPIKREVIMKVSLEILEEPMHWPTIMKKRPNFTRIILKN